MSYYGLIGLIDLIGRYVLIKQLICLSGDILYVHINLFNILHRHKFPSIIIFFYLANFDQPFAAYFPFVKFPLQDFLSIYVYNFMKLK